MMLELFSDMKHGNKTPVEEVVQSRGKYFKNRFVDGKGQGS